MSKTVEEQVRAVVAERLGVDPTELTDEVSLVDDLAADSLDVLEVAMSLEKALRVRFEDATLDAVRTFGELVDAAIELVARRDAVGRARLAAPTMIRASVHPARPATVPPAEKVVPLTAYEIEEIVEDALRAGPGAVLELRVPPDAPLDHLAPAVLRLSRRRIDVRILRHEAPRRVESPAA